MNKEQEKKFFELICVCNNQQQELERYKNIIDELEKWLKETVDDCSSIYATEQYECVLDKLKELKGE